MQQLNCFKPREIFNINTHAQFKLERQKDSDDSEEASNNDEEEIKKFLSEYNERSKSSMKKLDKNKARVDLEAYKPDSNASDTRRDITKGKKVIDYNIKVLREMIQKVKQSTNTKVSSKIAKKVDPAK